MRFSSIFRNGSPVISLEFFPPKDAAKLDDTKTLIQRLGTLNPAFMTVTYGAGGTTRGLTQELVRFIRQEVQVPAVQHLTCVSHSRDDVDELLRCIVEDGISHVLALRGDPPQGSDRFEAHPDGFSCARDLTRHITTTTGLSVAVAGYPEVHREAVSRQSDLAYLREKVEAGAEVIITQLFFDNDLYFQFVDDARKNGIDVPIVPGIMPIANVGQLRRFTGLCGASLPLSLTERLGQLEQDPAAVVEFGTEFAVRQGRGLLEGGAPGIHIYTLNRPHQVERILQELVQSDRPAMVRDGTTSEELNK